MEEILIIFLILIMIKLPILGNPFISFVLRRSRALMPVKPAPLLENSGIQQNTDFFIFFVECVKLPMLTFAPVIEKNKTRGHAKS
jgi:hypothetical protein